MSKNTSSSAFRKIDVDQYCEDNFREDDATDAASPPAGPDENEISAFLSQGKLAEALATVLNR